MKLNQSIIYYWLAKKFPVRFEKDRHTPLGFKRPVFYQADLDFSQTVVIIENDGLTALFENKSPVTDSLFLCTEAPRCSLKQVDATVIVIESAVSSHTVFNYLQEVYNRFDQWEARLNEIYYENGSFQDLIDSCEPILPEPIMLVDKRFHYAAYSRFDPAIMNQAFMDENNNSLPEVVNDFISDSSFQKFYDFPDIFDYAMGSPASTDEMICKNVFDHQVYVGRFVIILTHGSETPVKNHVRSVLSQLFITADKLYQKYQSFDLKAVALNSLREPLMQLLLNEPYSDEQWQKAASENGWKDGNQLQLIQLRSNTRYEKNIYTDYLSAEIEKKWPGCVCLSFRERLLMLINHDQYQSANQKSFSSQLPYFLRESLLMAGLSRTFELITALSSAFAQTEIALDFGTRESPTFWIYHFNDYACSCLLKNSLGVFTAEQICSEKLLALRHYDQTKHTDYYQTLLTYFDCRFNLAAAARQLYIHRSSLLNRLERITQLFDINFDSNDELLYLGLSLLILSRT